MPIPDYYLTHELTHKFSGNGYYFLQEVPGEPDCIHVVTQQDHRVWLADRSRIEKFTMSYEDPVTRKRTVKDVPIEPKFLEQLEGWRSGLASGEFKIVNNFLSKVKP